MVFPTRMMQFSDLPDDCLLLVFDQLPPDQLFKMLTVNKRINSLAFVKLQSNTKVIKLNRQSSRLLTTDCKHLDSNPNRTLVWDSFFAQTDDQPFHDPSKRAHFFRLLSICGKNVKSVDFGSCWLPSHVLVEVMLRCHKLECLKVGQSGVGEVEWIRVLDRIGLRMVHFAKQSTEDWTTPSEISMLKMIFAKCPNIKQIDWIRGSSFTNDFLTVFKSRSRKYRFKIMSAFGEIFQDVFEDLFEYFDATSLTWSKFGDRLERLSRLKFSAVNGPVHGVDFANLKKLDVSDAVLDYKSLALSRFPRLEEFSFNANCSFTEDDLDTLFKQMPSVKMLSIFCNGEGVLFSNFDPRLPLSSIHRLKNLETIKLFIWYAPITWQSEQFTQQMKQYVYGDSSTRIKSLKKLVVEMKYQSRYKLHALVEETVERMKRWQNGQQNRVEISFCQQKTNC